MKYRTNIFRIVFVLAIILAVDVCNGQIKATGLLKLDGIPSHIGREIRTVTDTGIHFDDTVFTSFLSLAKREYSFKFTSKSGDTSIFVGNENGIHYKLLLVFDSTSNMFKSFDLVDTSENGWWKIIMKLENVPVKDSMGFLVSTTAGSQLASSLLSFVYHDEYESGNKETTIFDGILRNDYRPNSTVYFRIKGFSSTKVESVQSVTDISKVYPNPSSSILSVETSTIQEKIEFFDQLGREVHIPEITRTDESISFNTSSLTPGIYWLRTGGQTQKIIIQR